MQKLLEKVLLGRITSAVVENTEKENAGFKPHMSCEMQLQRMKMYMLKNLRRRKPTYILSCDIKSAYDNVDQEKMFDHLRRSIIPELKGSDDL